MVATWLQSIASVEAAKVVDVALAGTITDAGTVRADRLELKVTMTPFVAAGWPRLTVQVLEDLGPRLVGLHDSEETSPEATRLTVELAELLLYEAVTVALALAAMAAVVAPNVAVVALATTVTDAGTVSEALVLDSAMLAPPVGAG